MTAVRAALAAATRALAPIEGDGARRVARALLGHVLGVPPERFLTDPDRLLDEAAAAAYAEALARRIGGEPLSRIVGHREFWSLDLVVGPETLDPRADTETLVSAALAAAPSKQELRVLDLGTGTGCILLALLAERPAARGIGVDASEGAVRIARTNARRLGLDDRATFLVGDWASALDGRFDIVASNPPYVRSHDIDALAPEVRVHDPHPALDGGSDGLDAYRRILPALDRLLAADGVAVIEIGFDQAADVAALAVASGLSVRQVARDLAHNDRCVVLVPKRPKSSENA